MAEMKIKNAITIDISTKVPSTAISLTMTITVSPGTGAVLIYSPRATDPVQFNGPQDTKEVPIEGPTIWAQLVQGTKEFHIEFVGWTDST
jgi:hypothetical protein